MAQDKEYLDGELENITLESILAEYKGSAFIDGDKKTPSDVLNQRADKIIMEMTGTGGAATSEHELTSLHSFVSATPAKRAHSDKEAKATLESVPHANPNPVISTADKDVLFFETYKYSKPETPEDIVKKVEKAIERQTAAIETTQESVRRGFSIFGREKKSDETKSEPYKEEFFAEPDLRDTSRIFAEQCNSVSIRCLSAVIISVIMAIMTFAFESGNILPFGIRDSVIRATGVLMIMQLVTMMLGADILVRGGSDLVRLSPNTETLVLFSCAFSLISGFYTILSANPGLGLPYSTVSSFSLSFAMWGEKLYLRAMADTLKTAITASEPYGVVAEYRDDIKKTVLKKVFRKTEGFFNNMTHPDISQTAYKFATPLLIVGALVLTMFTTVVKDVGPRVLQICSSMLASGAAFASVIAFALPFSIVARSIRKSGAAIAGWGGADDLFHTDGACITDDDLFPKGTLSLGSIKIFEEVTPEKAIRYTASLLIASGSGHSRLFSELLLKQGMTIIRIDEFACYEGGVGALIHGERVITGSGAFMNLQGIRVPEEMNVKNAVFTAVNDKLIAMFAIDYKPINSVQNALVLIMRWRVKLFFAVRDFNITPLMLTQKYKVPIDDIEYISIRNTYDISDESSAGTGRVAAVLTREGLGPFGEAITSGRLLRITALIATIVTVTSSFLGLLIMFYTAWTSASDAARPGNLLVYMTSMLIAALIVCGYTRCKK